MLILTVVMRLNNYTINEDGVRNTTDFDSQSEHENTRAAFKAWWDTASSFRETRETSGYRSRPRGIGD